MAHSLAEQLALRPRRHTPRRPVRLAGRAVPGAAAAATTHAGSGVTAATEPPRLRLAEPEERRGRLITGGLTTLVHLAGLAALLVAAALAPPELIERVIPVELVPIPEPVELPGANVEPAPAGPKAVGARRANAAELAASQILSPTQAAALRRDAMAAARRAIAQLNTDAAATRPSLPADITRRDVRGETLAARDAEAVAPAPAVRPQDVDPVRIDPAERAAPAPRAAAGPRAIDPQSITDLSVPEALAVLDSLPEARYDAGAVDAEALPPGFVPGEAVAIGVDTGVGPGVGEGWTAGGSGGGPGGPGTGAGGAGGTASGSGAAGTGGGSGGDGTAQGVVRCLESASVQRYLDMVRQRTSQRWTVPAGVPEDTEVQLRFALDAAGMANGVAGRDTDDSALSASARQALLAAAPFPPMVDANRCLTDKRIVLTFTVPAR